MPFLYAWADAIVVSLTRAADDVVSLVPRLLGAVVVLVAGRVCAGVAEGLAVRGLRAIGFGSLARRADADWLLERAGVSVGPTTAAGRLVFWSVMLTFGAAAANVSGLDQLGIALRSIVEFGPRLLVAIVTLLLGAAAAQLVGRSVRGATAGVIRVAEARVLGSACRWVVLGFVVLMAMDELQLAPTAVRTLSTAAAQMVALAGGLAFGLGGRHVARRMVEGWYARLSGEPPEARDTGRPRYGARPHTLLRRRERVAAGG